MHFKLIKNELQHILQGKSQDSNGTLIQAIASYLRRSEKASEMAESNQRNKTEETERLLNYINQHQLWNCDIDFDRFISAGAEQRVYIQDEKTVLKLNDAIYYTTWLEYFENLLLNNYFFPDTQYTLLGFYKSAENIIYALVTQPYVKATSPTNLAQVKEFLENNGFVNIRNHDYQHPSLGIILEDLHDENVLTKEDVLYFIDTVFYIKPEILWS